MHFHSYFNSLKSCFTGFEELLITELWASTLSLNFVQIKSDKLGFSLCLFHQYERVDYLCLPRSTHSNRPVVTSLSVDISSWTAQFPLSVTDLLYDNDLKLRSLDDSLLVANIDVAFNP